MGLLKKKTIECLTNTLPSRDEKYMCYQQRGKARYVQTKNVVSLSLESIQQDHQDQLR